MDRTKLSRRRGFILLRNYYYDVTKEAGFKDVAKEAAFKILGLRCKGASYRILGLSQYYSRANYYERSNYIRLPKVAYLISPKKNALRSTTRKINRVTRYFEENAKGIYKPPFRENPNNNEDDKEEPPRVKRKY
ncbi:hypothetical protein QBC39DRAFT_335421 [Podospora conica]|nr:hypothetical protein QBC39DRAFT_335421 [Schizothecium conicum]